MKKGMAFFFQRPDNGEMEWGEKTLYFSKDQENWHVGVDSQDLYFKMVLSFNDAKFHSSSRLIEENWIKETI